jgi:hypothetical protein
VQVSAIRPPPLLMIDQMNYPRQANSCSYKGTSNTHRRAVQCVDSG